MFHDTTENSEFPDVKLAETRNKQESPVSIFTTASKAFERTMHQQMSIFIGKFLSSNMTGYLQKQPPEMFCKKGVLRNFAKFSFLIKLAPVAASAYFSTFTLTCLIQLKLSVLTCAIMVMYL